MKLTLLLHFRLQMRDLQTMLNKVSRIDHHQQVKSRRTYCTRKSCQFPKVQNTEDMTNEFLKFDLSYELLQKCSTDQIGSASEEMAAPEDIRNGKLSSHRMSTLEFGSAIANKVERRLSLPTFSRFDRILSDERVERKNAISKADNAIEVETIEKFDLFFYSEYKQNEHEKTLYMEENDDVMDKGEFSLWNFWKLKEEVQHENERKSLQNHWQPKEEKIEGKEKILSEKESDIKAEKKLHIKPMKTVQVKTKKELDMRALSA